MPVSKSPVGERLRYIRETRDLTLRGFWKRLMADPKPRDFTVSEAAVRNYDMGCADDGSKREPPYSYLARVLECFPEVRAEWLLRGEGEPLDESRVVLPRGTHQRPLVDVVWEHFTEGAGFTPPETLRPLAMLLWRRRQRALGDPLHFDAATQVGRALFAPFRALFYHPAGLAAHELENICMALLPGIAAAADNVHVPDPEED